MKKKAIVVVGATASGKTALGVHIAKRFNGEVISADSMQIYKGMDIATAKPTTEEMDGVKHHLIDFVDVKNQYSVSNYCDDAKVIFDKVVENNKLPVIVGGTGLYIDSFLSNTKFLEAASSDTIRQELIVEAEKYGIDSLYEQLKVIDPDAAENIHPNNTVRVIRALEIYKTTGKTLTEQNKFSHTVESDIEPLYIGINYSDRENLYKRINLRVDLMLEAGLLEEAKEFFKLNPSKTAFNAIGYKELKPFIDGDLSFDVCVENLKRETRRYAKRQITWFKRNKNINWVYADELTKEEMHETVDKMIFDFLGGDMIEE
ncbi:MAG: tRNA (adenosine(37)-N6)-dimethylallyltransferase MiaA [Acutalibacteraceae bacterium]|nr:tRNA (adenosine(37)-N6)-dimethylallyltransferase MiaA [Acutalibacteraceae bacterium]